MQMIGAMKAEDMARFVKERTGASIPIFRYTFVVFLLVTDIVRIGREE